MARKRAPGDPADYVAAGLEVWKAAKAARGEKQYLDEWATEIHRLEFEAWHRAQYLHRFDEPRGVKPKDWIN